MILQDYNWFDKKRGWTRIRPHEEEYTKLIRMFEETVEYAKLIGENLGRIDNIAYYLNNQITAVASCNYHRWGDGTYDIGFCFNAEVFKQIPTEKLRQVVIHEVAHACTIGCHHNFDWQECCRRIGKKWGMQYLDFCRTEQNAAINAVMRSQKLARAKYLVKCPACGATWHKTKSCALTQHPWTWTCGCGWKGLEVTTL